MANDTETISFNISGGGLLRRILPKSFTARKILSVGAVLVAWLPVLVFCVVEESVTGKAFDIPFLTDPVPHARFLIGLPIFVAAGALINRRLTDVVSYVWNAGILVGDARPRFQTELGKANRRCDSVAADVIVVITAYATSLILAGRDVNDGVTSWFAFGAGAGEKITLAGWWYTLVSMPLWQAFALGWTWRIAVWWHFLWRMSRQDLRLLPTHPDRAGGLGIMQLGQSSMVVLVFGISSVFSAILADTLRSGGVTLMGLVPTVVVYLLLVLLFLYAPLLSFAARLFDAKRRGLVEYGDLADDLFGAFDQKWTNQPNEERRKLLGNPDPSSLADYGYAYEVVTEMRVILISRENLLSAVGVSLVPFFPLLLMNYSVKEIATRLLGILG